MIESRTGHGNVRLRCVNVNIGQMVSYKRGSVMGSIFDSSDRKSISLGEAGWGRLNECKIVDGGTSNC